MSGILFGGGARISKNSLFIASCFIVLALIPVLLLGSIPTGEDALEGVALGLMLFIGGTIIFVSGFSRFRQLQAVKNTPTSKIRSMAMGNVELKGQAEPKGESIISPMTQNDCVFYEYQVEENRDKKHSTWATIDSGRSTERFRITDETGEVEVDPRNIELFLEYDVNEVVDEDENPPETIKNFIEVNSDVEEDFNGRKRPLMNDKRRYREKYIAPSDEIYVFGEAAKDSETNQTIIEENKLMFAVADKSEKQFEEELESQYHLGLLGGALAAIIGYAITLGLAGLL